MWNARRRLKFLSWLASYFHPSSRISLILLSADASSLSTCARSLSPSCAYACSRLQGQGCGGDTNTMESNVEAGQKWRREQAHAQVGLNDLAHVERELASALSRIRLMREDGWK